MNFYYVPNFTCCKYFGEKFENSTSLFVSCFQHVLSDYVILININYFFVCLLYVFQNHFQRIIFWGISFQRILYFHLSTQSGSQIPHVRLQFFLVYLPFGGMHHPFSLFFSHFVIGHLSLHGSVQSPPHPSKGQFEQVSAYWVPHHT